MRCRFEPCHYNDGEGYCRLSQITVDNTGRCDDCIVIPAQPAAPEDCEDDDNN